MHDRAEPLNGRSPMPVCTACNSTWPTRFGVGAEKVLIVPKGVIRGQHRGQRYIAPTAHMTPPASGSSFPRGRPERSASRGDAVNAVGHGERDGVESCRSNLRGEFESPSQHAVEIRAPDGVLHRSKSEV